MQFDRLGSYPWPPAFSALNRTDQIASPLAHRQSDWTTDSSPGEFPAHLGTQETHLPYFLLPCSQEPPEQHKFSHMISIVIRSDQRLAQDGLSITVRNLGEEIG